MCAQSLSHIQLFVTTWSVACQAPLTMGFPRLVGWHFPLQIFYLWSIIFIGRLLKFSVHSSFHKYILKAYYIQRILLLELLRGCCEPNIHDVSLAEHSNVWWQTMKHTILTWMSLYCLVFRFLWEHIGDQKKKQVKKQKDGIWDWKLFPKSVMLNASGWVVKDEAREKITF